MKTEQNESEIEKGRHLRLRRVMAELTGASAMSFKAWVRVNYIGGECELERMGKGRRRGMARSFIGGQRCGRRKGSGSTVILVLSMQAQWAGSLP